MVSNDNFLIFLIFKWELFDSFEGQLIVAVTIYRTFGPIAVHVSLEGSKQDYIL